MDDDDFFAQRPYEEGEEKSEPNERRNSNKMESRLSIKEYRLSIKIKNHLVIADLIDPAG